MRKCIVVEIDFLDELQGVYVEFEIYNKQAVIYDAYLISKQVDKEEVYYLPNESHTEGPVYTSTILHGGHSNLELLTLYQRNQIRDLVEKNMKDCFNSPNELGSIIGINKRGE